MTARSGWLVVLAAVFAAVSGLGPAWYYAADPSGAHASVVELEHASVFGHALRSLHHFSSQACLVLLAAHVVVVLALKKERIEEPWRWISGVLAALLLAAAAFSGRVLPWDQHGAVSFTVGLSLLSPGAVAWLGPANGALGRILLLHLGASALLLWLTWSHLQGRSGLQRLWERPAAAWRDLLVASALLLLGSMLVRAPLGPQFEPAAAASAVTSEWYVRWVEVLAVRSGGLARWTLVALCAAALTTPWWGRRIGATRMRAAWWAVLSLVTLISLLPVR